LGIDLEKERPLLTYELVASESNKANALGTTVFAFPDTVVDCNTELWRFKTFAISLLGIYPGLCIKLVRIDCCMYDASSGLTNVPFIET
jgi:hypothetical protein